MLGRGGMADVRAGRDLRLDRPVAVKFLRPEMAQVDGVRERFEAEARAAASLVHPHVVSVFDTGEHEGVPYIVMERLPGRTLADEIAEGPLEPARVVAVAGEVLAALDIAHRAGIVHRDVKPGNVLLTPAGTTKVADFGIAKGAEAVDLTLTGQMLGTPAYLAPERVAGEAATPQSDLFAVAVMLYEALTGRRPFDADTPAGLLHAICQGRAAPLDELRPGLDPRLVEVIRRGMDKDPGRRFPTATAMAAALDDGRGRPAPAATVPLGGPSDTVLDAAPAGPSDTVVDAAPAAPSDTAVATRPPLPARLRRLDRKVLAAAAVLLAVLALAVAVAVAVRGGDERPAEVPAPTTSPGVDDAAVPEPLRRALDRLDQAVRP